MEDVGLREATTEDRSLVVDFDYSLNKLEHIELKREEKITKAILAKECLIILANNKAVGFVIFDYRFFDQGWIELIIIEEDYRGKGIGGRVFDLIGKKCKTNKVFTSTNSSNIQMQKALDKVGFTFAGEINGLDDGDPEWFYYKTTKNNVPAQNDYDA
ncbi:MAG: GNAT family N-acetyltransferase [Tunicatimonas sp.]